MVQQKREHQKSMRNIFKDYKRLSTIISEMIGDGNNLSIIVLPKYGLGTNSHKNIYTLIKQVLCNMRFCPHY